MSLHPLARVFLDERRSTARSRAGRGGRTRRASPRIAVRHEWDAAFDLIAGLASSASSRISCPLALDELLDTADFPRFEKWCELARRAAGVHAPIFALAQREVAFRRGRSRRIGRARRELPRLLNRVSVSRTLGRRACCAPRLARGGRAESFRRAEQVAAYRCRRLKTRSGDSLHAAIELEPPDAARMLDQLSDGVSFGDVRDVVRMAGHRIYLQLQRRGI